jgi:hypothetical protein
MQMSTLFRFGRSVILSGFWLTVFGVSFHLSTARSVPVDEISLAIQAKGHVVLNGKPMPAHVLVRAMSGLLQGSNRVVLHPQEGISYGDWLNVYEQLASLHRPELYVANRKDGKLVAFKIVKDSTAYSPDPIANFTHQSIRELQINLRTHIVNNKTGFANLSGEPVLPAIYSNAHDFTGPVTAVCINHKWGLIDRHGQTVLAPHYFNIARFSDGLAAMIEQTGDEFRSGFLDTAGQIVIPPQFQSVGAFYRGHAAAKSGDRWGLINKQGQWLLPARYEAIGQLAENRVAVRENNRWGYVDGQGHPVIPPHYDDVELFFQNAARVRIGDQYGFIDEQGRWLISPRNGEFARYFSEGLVAAKTDSLWGYMDRTGTYVIPPRFSTAMPFSEGVACVARWRDFGYIDHTGTWHIGPRFVLAMPFYHGLARVTVLEPDTDLSYGWDGFVDHAGNRIILNKKKFSKCQIMQDLTRKNAKR